MTNTTHPKKGLLLMNIGSPEAPTKTAVRRYLRRFLSDPRVIDLPRLLRSMLLYGVILPTRPKSSAKAYQAIWKSDGSPLISTSERMRCLLQAQLGETHLVAFGMRYSEPSIESALDALKDCEHITILPLYPQYSSAATGSSIEQALRHMASWNVFPSVNIIRDFYRDEDYINAQAACMRPYIEEASTPNHYVLFSYHGVPERHLMRLGCKPICATDCKPSGAERGCYRAQCLETTRLLATALNLTHYGSSFQSRLGKTPWIKPYTDVMLTTLIDQGIKHLIVACPSFVTDCLETLEEIDMRAKQQWLDLGGETFTTIPCLNDNVDWIQRRLLSPLI